MSVQISGSQIKNDAIDNSKIADDVQAAQIQANAVVAAKIASGAITEAKLGASAVSTAKIANSAVTSAKMDLSGTFDFSSGTLQAGTPSNASDVTNKSYVDGLVGSGVYWKEPARVASTANVTISNPGTDTFDGVQIASGDRILLKNQTAQAENGVYDFNGSSSALTRSSDANSAEELNGLAIFVKEGGNSGDQGFVQTSEIATLGTDNVVFAQFTGLGQITAGNGLSKSGNTLSVDAGDGLSFDGGQLEVELGAGLEFQAGAIDIEVDDSTLEVDAGTNEVRVKDLGIVSGKLANSAVSTAKIADDAVSSAKLADGAVSSIKLGASAVTEAKIAANAVTDAKLAANSVTASAIASAVAGDGLAGGAGSPLSVSVDNTGIEINSDSLRLKDLGVATAKIANNAVTTAKIINNAVTADKISSAVAGSGLLGGAGTALSVNCGDGLDFNGDAVDVQLGAGLEFQAGAIDVEVDDSTIEVDEVSNEVRVKDLGITSAKLANSAVSTAKIADDAVTAAKVGFQAYQELTTVSGSSTVNIDLAREVDSAFSNGIMAFKNGLALLNQTALGGSAANSDEFTLSVVGGVTRLSFGAALADADDILIVYMT
jgi:hypothetical protein